MMSETWKRVRKLKLRASISLVACILVVAITGVGLTTVRGISERSREVTLDRVLNLQTQQLLATYDRDLLERYGLWGFDPAGVSESQALKDLKQVSGILSYQFSPDYPLADSEVLLKQVVSFSKTRVSVALIDELIERVKDFRSAGNLLSTSPELQQAIEQVGSVFPRLPAGQPGIPDVIDDNPHYSTLSLNYTRYFDRARLAESMEPEEPALSEEEEAQVEEGLKKIYTFEKEIEALLNRPDAQDEDLIPILTPAPADTMVGHLLNLVNRGINLLDFEVPRIFNKVLFQEYILNQFSSQVRGPKAKTAEGKSFITLSGQKMSDLKFTSNFQAESILLTIENEFLARGAVVAALASTRLALNYLALLQDPARMAKHEAIAAVIVTGVAIASLGSVILEPLAVARLLALVDAGRLMLSDVSKLRKGEGVPLYPGNHALGKIDIYYTDYLRIMGVVPKLENQLAHAARILEKTAGHPLVSGGQHSVSFLSNRREQVIRRGWNYAVLNQGD